MGLDAPLLVSITSMFPAVDGIDVTSAAIAANLTAEMPMEQAVRAANRYVEAGIKTSYDIGKGSGPINHFHSTYSLPFAPYVAVSFISGTETN